MRRSCRPRTRSNGSTPQSRDPDKPWFVYLAFNESHASQVVRCLCRMQTRSTVMPRIRTWMARLQGDERCGGTFGSNQHRILHRRAAHAGHGQRHGHGDRQGAGCGRRNRFRHLRHLYRRQRHRHVYDSGDLVPKSTTCTSPQPAAGKGRSTKAAPGWPWRSGGPASRPAARAPSLSTLRTCSPPSWHWRGSHRRRQVPTVRGTGTVPFDSKSLTPILFGPRFRRARPERRLHPDGIRTLCQGQHIVGGGPERRPTRSSAPTQTVVRYTTAYRFLQTWLRIRWKSIR